MNSILTVVTAADTQDLTTLATVKAELGVTTSEHDEMLLRYVRQASSDCADHCNRVFGEEVLSEQFRIGYHERRPEALRLKRYPVTVPLTAVTENDTVLVVADDYELDPTNGMLRRLSSGCPSCWAWGKITVEYTAGYALLDSLPRSIEEACIELVKAAWYSRKRDPAIKSEQTEGVDAVTYFFGTPGEGGLPEAATSRLDKYRDLGFA